MADRQCPRVRLTRKRHKDSGIRWTEIDARAGRKSVGYTFVRQNESGPPYISSIQVEAILRRCGLGTKLYEAAAKEACTTYGQPLHSDIERSAASQGFWGKQVKKGRAVCVQAALTDEVDPNETGPAYGRGDCVRYKLTCPAPKDLSGLKRRKK